MRKTGGTEHERDTERQEVELRRLRGAILEPRVGERFTRTIDRRREQLGEVAAYRDDDEQAHDKHAADQQNSLDHLHIRCALHAADEDVEDHEHADDRHDNGLPGLAIDVEQERNESAGARHLRDQVEQAHRECRKRSGHAHRPLLQAEREHVSHREAAGIAHQLRHEQQGYEPGHQEADGI